VFSISLWCLGLLWVHLFISVSSCILYFWCIGFLGCILYIFVNCV
jgi:hypothetical protein